MLSINLSVSGSIETNCLVEGKYVRDMKYLLND